MWNICEMYSLYLKKMVSILNDLLLVIAENIFQAARYEIVYLELISA